MVANLQAIPVWAVALLGVLAVVEVALDVIALVDLYRCPSERVVFGNKWIWVGIVLVVGFIGAILYLVAGRKPAVIADGTASSAAISGRSEDIADALYGPRDGDEHK